MPGVRRALSAAVLLGLIGCAAPSPVPAWQETPTAPGTNTLDECPDVQLRTPTGEPINLSGTWVSGSERAYYVYQSGACVWWAGGFATSDTSDRLRYDGLGWATFVFIGQLAADFTVSGTWSVVRTGGEARTRYWGTATYQVEFEDPDGLVLRRTDLGGPGQELGIPPDETLSRISDLAIPPP
jgi:hypothetical protein